MKYSVSYIDDFNQKHLTFVSSLKEFDFIRDRFENAEIVDCFYSNSNLN